MKIRMFSNDEIEDCAILYADTFTRPPWNEHWTLKRSLSMVNRIINKKYFFGLTAEYDNKAVGYLLGYILNITFPLIKIYYINELFVDVTYQNMKIGKELVNKLLKNMKSKGIPLIILLTKMDTNAEMFYKRMGFRRLLKRFNINKRIIMYYHRNQNISSELEEKGALK